jgi:hypothetical protein
VWCGAWLLAEAALIPELIGFGRWIVMPASSQAKI